MSMQDEELEAGHEDLPPDIQALLRQGRKAQKELEVERTARQQAEKAAAVVAAGIPDHPTRELVFRDYDGPLEADAIKAHAEKFGLVKAQDPVSQEEQAVTRQILNAGAGAPAPSGDVDLAVALRNAKSQQEVLDIVRQAQGLPNFHGVLPEY